MTLSDYFPCIEGVVFAVFDGDENQADNDGDNEFDRAENAFSGDTIEEALAIGAPFFPGQPKRLTLKVAACSAAFCFLALVLFGGVVLGLDEIGDLVFYAIVSCAPFLLLTFQSLTLCDRLPRTVSVDDGLLQIIYRDAIDTCLLADCYWYEGNTKDDGVAKQLGLRLPAIIIVRPMDPLRRKRSMQVIACGLMPNMYGRWNTFLVRNEVRRRPEPIGLLLQCLYFLVGAGLFAGAGFALGTSINVLFGPNILGDAVKLSGYVMAPVLSVAYVMCLYVRPVIPVPSTRWKWYLCSSGCGGFSLAGSMAFWCCDAAPGVIASVAVVTFHGVIGFFVGWRFYHRLSERAKKW